MNILQRPSNDYVMAGATIKDVEVWHFTAGGSLAGAEATLALPDTINVHFMIDKDGKIYQYMKEERWAYHTGQNAAKDKNGNYWYWCRRSFGIEIVNWGGLDKVGDLFIPYTKRKTQAVNPDRVLKLYFARFGYRYYEALTPAQIDSMLWLDDYLRARHPITMSITHADISTKKHDFPPDYPWIPRTPDNFYYDYSGLLVPEEKQVVTFVDGRTPYQCPTGQPKPPSTAIPANNTGSSNDYNPKTTPILQGQEKLYNKSQIQARINYLIKVAGWGNAELVRLTNYRDNAK